MSSENTEILEFNQYQKSDRTPTIIHTDLDSLIKNWMDVTTILKNYLQQKVSQYIPSGFTISTISSLKDIKNKHDVLRGEDCMKKFCECLKNKQVG